MIRAERQARILQLIRERGFIENDELARLLGVTPTTIRRDLKALSAQNLIKLDHGGSADADYLGTFVEPLYETKFYLHQAQKQAIGAAAAALVQDHETVFLDSGTTNVQIARHLRRSPAKNVTVITPDIRTASELCSAQNVTVLVLGGVLRKAYYSLYGHYAEGMLRTLKPNRMFLGADAVSLRFGVSNSVVEEVPLKQLAMALSNETVLVADFSKFGAEATYHVCGWDAVQQVISDNNLPEAYRVFLAERGIRLTLADTPAESEPHTSADS